MPTQSRFSVYFGALNLTPYLSDMLDNVFIFSSVPVSFKEDLQILLDPYQNTGAIMSLFHANGESARLRPVNFSLGWSNDGNESLCTIVDNEGFFLRLYFTWEGCNE
jgi:hypothetical protein